MIVAVLAAAVVSLSLIGRGPAVDADADGFFVSRGPAPAREMFPGSATRLAFVGADGRLVGRVEADAEDPAVWTRDGAGALAPLALRVSRTQESQRPAVRAALVAALATAPPSPTLAAFAESCGAVAAPPSGIAPGDGAGPVSARSPVPAATPGMPLEDWAPSECLFVRFRSVEAAYRFASEFDRLAAALLAAEREDARDYGTLRLALHDLLLPTIWRTNPDATRGTGEVGLVIAPPFVRGRPRVAVLMRIVDPELHRMQTVAGIAQESAPDHLWRPADDPFPIERERIAFRATLPEAPDVEIVATDRALGERIGSLRSVPVARRDGFRHLRAPTTDAARRPGPEEALFGYSPFGEDPAWRALVPHMARSAVREFREGLGLARLAERCLGDARASLVNDPHPRGPDWLGDVSALRVTTDAKGAAFAVTCAAADTAARFANVLRGVASAGAAADRACIANLRDLVPLAIAENPAGDVAERNFVVLGWKPVCPCGGTYSLHPVTREASCSAHGTARSPRAGNWKPPGLTEIRAAGSELSFRLAIDWNRKE